MRFHSAMATLEPQKYVIARTVWTENILLVSGRFVYLVPTITILGDAVNFGNNRCFQGFFMPGRFRDSHMSLYNYSLLVKDNDKNKF